MRFQPKAQLSKACHDLNAERRWILSGSPIINSSKDLGALLHFLRLCAPLDDIKTWSKCIEKKVRRGQGAILLQAVVASTTLRRTKEMRDAAGIPIIELPPLKVYVHKVALDADVRELYDEIERAVQSNVIRQIANGNFSRSYSAMLVFLLRLRQIACHPDLCPREFVDEVRASVAANAAAAAVPSVEAAAGEDAGMSSEQRKALQRTLVEIAQEDCAICFSLPDEWVPSQLSAYNPDLICRPVITPCSHAFCSQYVGRFHPHSVVQLAAGASPRSSRTPRPSSRRHSARCAAAASPRRLSSLCPRGRLTSPKRSRRSPGTRRSLARSWPRWPRRCSRPRRASSFASSAAPNRRAVAPSSSPRCGASAPIRTWAGA
jgi:hypothetical protein